MGKHRTDARFGVYAIVSIQLNSLAAAYKSLYNILIFILVLVKVKIR